MKTLVPTPYTKILVRKRFLQQNAEPDGLIEAYLVAVCVVLNEAPKLMVMTREGAMFCYVPPNAVCFEEDAPLLGVLDVCMWDCLADRAEIVELEFIRHFDMEWKSGTNVVHKGRYMFSLHFDPRQAWGRIPEQLKIFHFLEGADGNLHIAVNNQSRFLCDAFEIGEMSCRPESNMQVWFCE
jgi:hypothetical protein